MTHKDLLASLQKVCRRDSQHCSIMLNALCKLMAQAGVEQVPVTLPGLGTFTSHKHPEYIQEDKQSGRQTLYPPRITYRMNPEEETAYEGTPTQPDLLEQQLAKQSDSSVEEAGIFIKALTDSILLSLDRGESVEVHGLGTFQIVSSRQGELQRVAYTPDEQMRQAVNAPFECFEPVPIVDPTAAVAATAVLAEEPEETVPEKPIIVTPQTNIDMKDSEDLEQNIEQPVIAPEPESIETPLAEEPEPADPVKEFKPVEAEVSGEPVSISDHYQEFADERKKTPLIYAFSALLVLACIALGWFIYKLDRPGASTYTYNRDVIEQAYQEKTDEPAATEEEDAPEVFFGEADEVVAEESLVDAAAAEAEAQAAAEAARIAAEKEAAEKAAAEKIAAEKAAAEKIAAEKTASQKQAAEKAATATTSNNATVGRLKNADGSYATHKLEAGSRLTLVALEHYGDKAFWPYVYEVNRDKLKSPSLVQPGMVLYLPDPKHFGIDANDPASVAKAKAKAAQYLK